MRQADYDELARQKATAAALHAERTATRRQTIARLVAAEPERALAAAERTLARKTAPQQQWSREAWREILRTKSPSQIARLLVRPRAEQAALVDSHPFGGLLRAAHGR